MQKFQVEHPSRPERVSLQQHKQINQMDKLLVIQNQVPQEMTKRKKQKLKTSIPICSTKRKRTRAALQQHQKNQAHLPHKLALRTEETHNRNSREQAKIFLNGAWRVLLTYLLVKEIKELL